MHHRVDLETAAALGCPKCVDELETGKKTNRSHESTCPRSRSYRYRPGGMANASAALDKAPAASAAAAAAAAAAGSKRKRPPPQSQDDNKREEEGEEDDDVDVDINSNTYISSGGDPNNPEMANNPLRMGNNVDFPLSNLRPHLICSLCRGYFRDPYTVADCLHTFCRSCLILFFRQGMRCCPTCNTRLGPDPFHTSISIQCREVIPDRTLQEVVNKIFPWMKAMEEEEEREFYIHRGVDLKPEYVQESKASPSPAWRNRKGDSAPAAGTMNDILDLHLEPDGRPPHLHQRLPPLSKSSLRVSGKLKVVSLKKYLVQKLGIKESKNSIEILCNGDQMGDELSLTFILRTRWFAPNRVLTLKYRLEPGEDDNK